MKIFFAFFLSLFSYLLSFAQEKGIIRVDPKDYTKFMLENAYKYPIFTKANIYLKSGDIANVRFNYDYINHALKYIGVKGDTLLIVNEKDVKYITTAIDTIFIDNKFYEWMASSSSARIVNTHLLKFKYTDTKLTNTWTDSPAFHIETHDAILENTNIALHPANTTVFLKEIQYYIYNIKDGHYLEANKKNLNKLYPDRHIDEYIKFNKFDLDNEKDLLDIFKYVSTKEEE